MADSTRTPPARSGGQPLQRSSGMPIGPTGLGQAQAPFGIIQQRSGMHHRGPEQPIGAHAQHEMQRRDGRRELPAVAGTKSASSVTVITHRRQPAATRWAPARSGSRRMQSDDHPHRQRQHRREAQAAATGAQPMPNASASQESPQLARPQQPAAPAGRAARPPRTAWPASPPPAARRRSVGTWPSIESSAQFTFAAYAPGGRIAMASDPFRSAVTAGQDHARQARITEINVQDMLREVRMALLEADVALPVVRDFVARVKDKALARRWPARSTRPGAGGHRPRTGHHGRRRGPRPGAQPPAVILMAGLQGGQDHHHGQAGRHLIERARRRCSPSRPTSTGRPPSNS